MLDHMGKYVDLRRKGDSTPRLIVALRTELHRILAEAAIAAGAEIVTDSKAIGARPDGTLELEGGKTCQADLVVGADGVHSRVRDSLGLLSKLVELRDGCGRHLVPRKESDGVNSQRLESWTGGRRIGIAPASRDYNYVFLCCSADDTEGRMQQPFNLAAWVGRIPG
ncbi:MAG: FAD-dependent monooxygenase [Alphaproteobacteria bacterium]|nr:hypothetical protein [Rhodospirillaceae bacterium]MBT7613322.1 hypothetical protein [Rhodospirillaceae bacterium]MDG2479429.1 FAD-dependent monooxygenase [Alphaproteobacteria bacterium]